MMTEITLEACGPLLFAEEEMRSERQARLLEAGEYPDKGLTVTKEDLDGLVARFAEGVPVKIEHTDSPLDPLGKVCQIWREGGALFGTLAFPDDLAVFMRRRGAAKLSVGLLRDPLRLAEVSLVLKPRVAAATLLSQSAEDPCTLSSGGTRALQAEIVRLREELTDWKVDAQIALLKSQGRIVPASEALARALLSTPEQAMVTLSAGQEPVAEVFRRFLVAQPVVVRFGETVAAAKSTEIDGFTQYEHMFLSERLGVDPEKVAELLREEAEEKGNSDAS